MASRSAGARPAGARPAQQHCPRVQRVLMERPLVTSSLLAKRNRLALATVSRLLGHLETLGIVEELIAQKRHQVFTHSDDLEILNRSTELPDT